ncbi:hypothetical protein SISSUDRAFT_899840 [Sistotremastrum suecicum HHB10207 ss-3]|uniref:PCI domain-containing protein n=1 Tax=Sistotremastrum suecicum HHB10207 ss-3 TaxID=1314776 RepID=A0A166HG63_9AGAM|nr:hypothetical protein SISSUDRAFT_899840 [Sistotremastrum suecicum HHB10207 ss-3]
MTRHMQNIPSISRASGLDKDGDTLKDFKVQEEYFKFIAGKIAAYWRRYPVPNEQAWNWRPALKGAQKEEQDNILIQLRKLREGVLSTKRKDAFSITVYEISYLLTIIFQSTFLPVQSSLSHLVEELYPGVSKASPFYPLPMNSTPGLYSGNHRQFITFLDLLNAVVSNFPRLSPFHEILSGSCHSLPPNTRGWLSSVASALSHKNYARLSDLTTTESCRSTLEAVRNPLASYSENDLHGLAFLALRRALRQKGREQAWSVMRVGYREFKHPVDGWISRMLLFDTQDEVKLWLKSLITEGLLSLKGTTPETYIITKRKV